MEKRISISTMDEIETINRNSYDEAEKDALHRIETYQAAIDALGKVVELEEERDKRFYEDCIDALNRSIKEILRWHEDYVKTGGISI